MAESERIEASFSGHVQGVGFRFTVLDVVSRFPEVTGYVRNTADGRVELVAEGPSAQVKSLMSAVERSMAGYIHNVETYAGEPTGEFSDFGIRR